MSRDVHQFWDAAHKQIFLTGNKVSMQIHGGNKLQFCAGDVVSHQEWGVGCVLEVGTGPQPEIIVKFPRKPRHRMSLQLAGRALSKLPADGLEALLLNEPGKVAQWSKIAPLKLIGVALVDLGKAAKPIELRAKLDGRNLLSTKWESWWKRVQPAIRQSSCFRVRPNGLYELTLPVEQIPESALPPSPKKAPTQKITSDQVQEIVLRLEEGGIEFESVKGAKTLRLVAKEIAQRSTISERARSAAMKGLAGPVLSARVILEAFSKYGRPTDLMEALVQLTSYIQVLAAAPTKEKGKKLGEHIMSKLHLLEDATRELAKHQQLEEDLSLMPTFVEALLQLALILWRKEMSGWRSVSLNCICNAAAVLAEKQPRVFTIAGEYLARNESNIWSRVAIADSLLAKVAVEVRSEAVDRLLLGSLVRPSEFTEECFLRHVNKERQLSWISWALSQVLLSCNAPTSEALARLLLRKEPQLEPEEQKMFTNLAIAVASVNPQIQAVLSPAIQEKLKERLDSSALEITGLTAQSQAFTVLDAIESASRSKLAEEKQKSRDVHARLESEIKGLQLVLETTKAKCARLEETAEQLRSSYRLPERWASFQGKKEILKTLVDLYQEAFRAKNVDIKATSWLLQRLQNLLQKQGVSSFGQVGSHANYDPALHEFIPGFEGVSKGVEIKCPGFEWSDPSGNRIILARAKVVRC